MVSNIAMINYMVVLFGAVCIIVLVFFKEIVNPKFKAKFHLPLPIELLIVSYICKYIMFSSNLQLLFNVSSLFECITHRNVFSLYVI